MIIILCTRGLRRLRDDHVDLVASARSGQPSGIGVANGISGIHWSVADHGCVSPRDIPMLELRMTYALQMTPNLLQSV